VAAPLVLGARGCDPRGEGRPQPRQAAPASVRGLLRLSAYGEDARAGGAPLRHVSVWVNGRDYAGMEDNDLRGYLDGRFKYGWNQPSQAHVRAGRATTGLRWGEYEIFRALQRWDHVRLPREARVHRAALTLSIEDSPHHEVPVVLYAVNKDWNPGQGGERHDNNSPPVPGEVWWDEVAHGHRPWGLPGAGFASDTHPDADTPAMALAESRYREGDGRLVFESEALRAYAERRVREGRPLLFLIKLTDAEEDRASTQLTFYSANVDGPRHGERRPRLLLEWDSPAERVRLERPVHLEHGRGAVLEGLDLGGARSLAASFLAEEGFEAPSLQLRASGSNEPWRPLAAVASVPAQRIDLRLVAAFDPVVVGHPFETEFRDTWVRSAPPEEQEVEYTFVAPRGARHHVAASYAGDYRWKVAFTPSEIGRWRYYFRHQLEDPYKSSEGFFDVLPGDREDVARQLRELLAEVRASHPNVEKGQHAEVVHRYGERFWRLERAAMQLETPESFRSEAGQEMLRLITELREAMSGRRVPDEIELEAMGREW
jgi:hypothetical protein